MTLKKNLRHHLKEGRYKYRLIKTGIQNLFSRWQLNKLFLRFSNFTMILQEDYLSNLAIAKNAENVEGAIVECGVWRGGMIAGIACLLGKNRSYYLFDSYEGLPPVNEIDGADAVKWQMDKESLYYYDNCKAEVDFARQAMNLALGEDSKNVFFIEGWFNETLTPENFNDKIALLRLDADWYESTMDCLNFLFPKVVPGGIIIIDDYYTWEGCTKAVHDYLSLNKRAEKICQFENRIAYLIKK